MATNSDPRRVSNTSSSPTFPSTMPPSETRSTSPPIPKSNPLFSAIVFSSQPAGSPAGVQCSEHDLFSSDACTPDGGSHLTDLKKGPDRDILIFLTRPRGGMCEWLKQAVLKTALP